jgi:rhodanese-related sulfurtransferase
MKTKLFLMTIAISLMMACTNKNEIKTVDAKQFKVEIEKPDVQLIDVRANDLYSEGHIPGAVNIALESPDFLSQIEMLDKDNTVAVYCRGGRQSKEAAEKLSAAGFKVVELEGGILTWDGEVSSNVK